METAGDKLSFLGGLLLATSGILLVISVILAITMFLPPVKKAYANGPEDWWTDRVLRWRLIRLVSVVVTAIVLMLIATKI